MPLRQILTEVSRSLVPYKGRLIGALIFILFHTSLGFLLILATSRFRVDHLPLILVLLFSVHHLLSVFDDWILTDLSARWVQTTRKNCLRRFLSSRNKSVQNSQTDWVELQLEIHWLGESIFSMLRGSLRKILQLVVFSIVLVWLSPILFLFCGLLFLLVILLGAFMGGWTNRIQEQYIIAQSSCSNFELEVTRAMPVIRSFQKGNFISHLHEKFLQSTTDKSIFLSRLRMITHPIQIVLFLITLLLVYLVGSNLVAEGSLSQGHFYSFIAGLSLLHAPLSALPQDISIALSHQEMRYLHEIFAAESSETNPGKTKSTRESIQAAHLQFQYPDGPNIFQDLNFGVMQGEILGFKGSNGSGKTTLAMLIAGIYHPTDGKIDHFPLESMDNPISYIDQQGTVFSLSLEENLFFEIKNKNDPPSYSPLFQEFLQSNHSRHISPETISSGQKKIFSIERALQQDHDLFIIDEPENSLDTEKKEILSKILLNLKTQQKILIIFSHDQHFLELCDQVKELA